MMKRLLRLVPGRCRPKHPGTRYHDTQQSLLELALELARINHRLAEIQSTIDLPPNLAEMEEDQVPQNVSVYVSGIIGYVRRDLLEDAIDTLKRASEITDAELRAEHISEQQGVVRPSPAKPSAYAIVFAPPLSGPIIFLTIISLSPRS